MPTYTWPACLVEVSSAHARMVENGEAALRRGDGQQARAWAQAAKSLLDGMRHLSEYFARLVPYAREGDTLKDVAGRAKDAGDAEVAAALDRVAELALRAPARGSVGEVA